MRTEGVKRRRMTYLRPPSICTRVASDRLRAVRVCKHLFRASFPFGVNGRTTRTTLWSDCHIGELERSGKRRRMQQDNFISMAVASYKKRDPAVRQCDKKKAVRLAGGSSKENFFPSRVSANRMQSPMKPTSG